MTIARIGIALALVASLSACKYEVTPAEDTPEPVETETAEEEGETVSILRPDVEAEQEEALADVLDPLNVTVGFPEGGADLDEAALKALQEVMGSQQIEFGGPIVLRAHSDSAGSDRANADASEERGLAVAAWLIEQGVGEDRIDVIVFGEQNPVEPNALPDGSPNEEGRALNRRVEVLIVPPETTDEAEASEARD